MIKITKEAWNPDSPNLREDLAWFNYALRLGYKARASGPIIDGVPIQPIIYDIKNKSIWSIGVGWICANLIDGKWCNHRNYAHLIDALHKESE
jgi:hypothetical protein